MKISLIEIKKEVVSEYKRVISKTMGDIASDTKHIEALYDLGYLAIQIKAVKEGLRANIKTLMIEEICKGLEEKGFAVNNCVFGIGSYTYQYNTRDTFGFALKATHAVINNKEKFIFKDPKTDKRIL